MEFRHLRYFVAVAEERNFTRAAERLNVAQSPLSQQIRKLEREMGVQLFDRTTRTVELTPAGVAFHERCTAVLAAATDAVDAAQKVSRGELGRLSVGFTGSASYELLPMLVRSYHDRNPDVTLDLRTEMFTSAQATALLQGELDVGVLRPPVPRSGLVVEILRHDAMAALLPTSHPAAINRSVDLASLRDEWFISFPPSPVSILQATLLEACAKAGFAPSIRHVVSDTAAMVTLVAAGLGVAVVPSSLRHLGIAGAVYRELRAPSTTVPLALAYREGDRSPLVRRFVETARAVVVSRQHIAAETPPPDGGHGADDDDFVSVPL